jgi:hypothetical protein
LSNVGSSGTTLGGKLMASVLGFNDVDNIHTRGDSVMNRKIAIKA